MKPGSQTLLRVVDASHKFIGWLIVPIEKLGAFQIGLRLPSGTLLAVDLDYLRTWRKPPELILNNGNWYTLSY